MITKTAVGALAAAVAVAAFSSGALAQARDEIRIVGSSTVFPFTTAAAETFGRDTGFPTPVVESTGTGGGMRLFCAGIGAAHPDITGASRRIKSSEFETCTGNGIETTEVKIGFDGIVLANAIGAPQFDLTREQMFLALAKTVPANGEAGGELVANPFTNWSQIDGSLPDQEILVFGPPPTSGTRDAWVELVMIAGGEALGIEDEEVLETMREDGLFVEAGENDNLIVQRLADDDHALGIFGFSFLDQNRDIIKGSKVEGVDPEFDLIAAGDYPVSRSLFFYVKNAHVGVIPGIEEYVAEFTSEGAWGPDGYLADKGLIPLPEAERRQSAEIANNLRPLSL